VELRQYRHVLALADDASPATDNRFEVAVRRRHPGRRRRQPTETLRLLCKIFENRFRFRPEPWQNVKFPLMLVIRCRAPLTPQTAHPTMPPKDNVQPAAPRSSQYFSTAGPTVGPILLSDDFLCGCSAPASSFLKPLLPKVER
jgi:hypothetical protein